MPLLRESFILFGIALIPCAMLAGLLMYGNPIHDFHAWRLKQNFYAKNIEHPADSMLIEKKFYLGGISVHGGDVCAYAVGEWRTSTISKQEIIDTYNSIEVSLGAEKIPVKVMFAGEYDSPNILPDEYWQDYLRGTVTDERVHYIMYVSAKRPIVWFDFRCNA